MQQDADVHVAKHDQGRSCESKAMMTEITTLRGVQANVCQAAELSRVVRNGTAQGLGRSEWAVHVQYLGRHQRGKHAVTEVILLPVEGFSSMMPSIHVVAECRDTTVGRGEATDAQPVEVLAHIEAGRGDLVYASADGARSLAPLEKVVPFCV